MKHPYKHGMTVLKIDKRDTYHGVGDDLRNNDVFSMWWGFLRLVRSEIEVVHCLSRCTIITTDNPRPLITSSRADEYDVIIVHL